MKTERCREWRELARRLRARATSPARSAPGSRRTSRAAPSAAPSSSSLALGRRACCRTPTRRASARRRRRRPSSATRVAARSSSERRTGAAPAPAARSASAFGGAAAAAAAAVLAIFVLAGRRAGEPEQHVTFASLPPGVKIGATLEPHAFGTEIHMYVQRRPLGHALPGLPARAGRRPRLGRHLPLPLGRRLRRRAQLRRSTSPAPRRSASTPATEPSSRRSATPTAAALPTPTEEEAT